ncbi:MAG TPA: hypothetical protein VG474_05705 [Solirubrobacteraceae bacterium]|nr:hypothetical protein [Solirubrobacteraceae bacterium]
MTPLALGAGSWAIVGFLVVLFLAVAYGVYSRSGSAIDQHPYDDTGGDAPGAEIPSTLGRDVERHDRSHGAR